MATAKKKTTKKVVKKSTKVAKKPTKKVAAKKTTKAKAAPAKKTTTKKAKAAPAKKAPAKKAAPVKKTTKAVSKKVVAKKVTKKVAAKKTTKAVAAKTIKKAAPKKTTTKKVVAKKVTTKKIAATPVKKEKVISTKASTKALKADKDTKGKKGKPASVSAEKTNKNKIDLEEEVLDTKKIKHLDEEDDFEVIVPKMQKIPKEGSIADLEVKIQEEIQGLTESFAWGEISDAIASLDFFVNHRTDDCGEKGCDNLRTTQKFCRLHYIANWYDVQKKREILKEGKLQVYIEELVAKYPPNLIETIVSDLQDDKEFHRALNELNIHSDFEMSEEDFEGVDEDNDDDDDIVEARSFTTHRYEED